MIGIKILTFLAFFLCLLLQIPAIMKGMWIGYSGAGFIVGMIVAHIIHEIFDTNNSKY